MGIDSKWKIQIGTMPKGPKNKISDVLGVKVGHVTLADKDIQTGVSAILAHEGNIFKEKVRCATHVINGFGKSVGLIQIDELGTLETPILLTNTLSVGMASHALVKYMLAQNDDIGESTGSVNPVVCECNDSKLNNIRALSIKEEHIFEAIKNASSDFEEGAIGAGRGMCAHELKGGIGSASRMFTLDDKNYTLGALVLTNYGLYQDLIVKHELLSEKKACPSSFENDKGSIIIILATDAPVNERQLKRLCKRSVVGLSRVGSYMSNGSGEIAIAFSVADKVPHYASKTILDTHCIHDDALNIVFRAVIESVEEAILSSMLHAEPVRGKNDTYVESLANIIK